MNIEKEIRNIFIDILLGKNDSYQSLSDSDLFFLLFVIWLNSKKEN